MLKKIFSLATAALSVLLIALPAVTYASSGSISLSSNKKTVPAGSTVIIAVYMNGGGNAVNAVQVDLSYTASKLQYVGYSASGSAFEIGATSGGGGGTATIARGTIGSVSGSALVGTVTFKALAGSGSTGIAVSGSSSLVSNGSAVPYGSSGVTVNFGSAPVSTSNSTAKPVTETPPPPKDTTAPTISNLKVSDLTPFSATVTWKTSEAADSVVEFGVDANYGLSTSVSEKTTDHKVVLSSAFLSPLNLLHYHVKSSDAAGNVATSPDKSFQLPGVPVVIVIKGEDGKPQAGVTVTIDGESGITKENGSVTLHTGLGNKTITSNYNGVTVQKRITVNKSPKPLPPYQLDLARQPVNKWMLMSVGLSVVVLTLLGIDAMLFGSKILARLTGIHIHRERSPVAVAASNPVPTNLVDKQSETTKDTLPHDYTSENKPDNSDLPEAVKELAVTETAQSSAPSPTPQPIKLHDSAPINIQLTPLQSVPSAPTIAAPGSGSTVRKITVAELTETNQATQPKTAKSVKKKTTTKKTAKKTPKVTRGGTADRSK